MAVSRHAIYRTSPPIRGVADEGITTVHSVWDTLPDAIAQLNRISRDDGSMGRYTGTHFIQPYHGNVVSSNKLRVSSMEHSTRLHGPYR